MSNNEKKLTGYPHIDKPWMKYYDENALEKSIPEKNIYEYMKDQTKANSDMTAISYYGNKISYENLYTKIDDASRVFKELGVKNGDRIMYLMPNIPETAYMLYGGSQIGAVSDYVDPRPDSIDLKVSANKILSLFEEEKAKYIVALEQCYLGMLKPIENELKELGLENIVIVSASDSMNFKSKMNYLGEIAKFNGTKNLKVQLDKMKKMSEMMAAAEKSSQLELLKYSELLKDCKNSHFKVAEYEPGKLTAIVHTSGTSSPKPKAIPLTNDNLNAYDHQTRSANMPMEAGDKALHVLPYFAAFGLVDVVHSGLCHNNDLIQVPEFAPANLGKLILKYKPQTVIGTPTWFLSLQNDPVMKNADLSFLKMVTFGGDSMEVEDEIRINEFLSNHNCDCKLTKGHGMSETCGCASYATGDYNKLGSVGIPLPNTVYALVDPETKEMLKFEDGKDVIEGELIISSKTITPGILDGKEIVPHVKYDDEDYIFTRDIAKMDRNGIMTFLSRSDRSFTRYDGFKIKPHEIENVIKRDKGIKYCVVSPYNDEEKFGNMSLASIVLEDGIELTEAEKMKFVEKIVNDYFVNNPYVSSRQIPSKFSFRKNMPLTANGKLNYNEIINEGLNGNEITVELEETNISIEGIRITGPSEANIYMKRK